MKFRCYQQLEHSDCGLACIRMLARHFGAKIPASVIRTMADINRVGISVKDIVTISDALGMTATPLALRESDADRMPLPAIIHWEQRHFVVLYEISHGGTRFHIADPACGKLTYTRQEFMEKWLMDADRSTVILAGPREEFYTRTYDKPHTLRALGRDMWSTIRENRKDFAAIIGIAAIVMATDIAMPFIFQQTVDTGIATADIPLVWLLVLGQLALFVGNNLMSSVSQVIMTKLGLNMSLGMMNRYLGKLVGLPMDFFERKVGADLIQKIQDQERLKDFMTTTPDTAFFTVITLIVFSGILIWYDLGIFLIFIGLTSLNMGWTALFLRKRREIDYCYFNCLSQNRNNIYELINGMPEIKSNSAEQSRIDLWGALQARINGLSMKSLYMRLYMNGGTTFISRMRDLVITGLCATMVIRGQMSIGMMMAVGYITGRVATPFSTLFASVGNVQDAVISYERLDEILGYQSAERSEEKASDDGDIEICDVVFKYPGSANPNVLDGISFTIPRNRITAMVGESGCGKSTLVKVIAGLYRPQRGHVAVGEYALEALDTDDWLRRCGIVMQDGFLFSGTIASNIALGDAEPDMERVKEAAKMACLDEFISRYPAGYSTRVGHAGMQLSGGQRQRLFIARAIYKNPEILLLDEATSSLDANTERQIVENLKNFYRGRTVIISAHRLSTVADADQIILMKNGKVSEAGSHESLITQKGSYYELVKNQMMVAATL